ncbi:MAG: phosphosulfolactate synthase [Bacteroidia bacterium]|jgi:phosphosulfolactate synthase
MKINLSHIPERPQKPRSNGLNMVMDKGLSIRQAQDLVEVSSNLIDFIKLGFGTSYATPNVLEKIKVYQSAGIKVYLGGTFLEAFIKRNALIEYYRILDEWNLDTVEVSDGSIHISNKLKCKLIEHLAKRALVLSEVGSKEEGILIAPNKWKQMIQDERNAGAWKVIAEARESGTVGIYRPSGKAHTSLVSKILAAVDQNHLIWEAPQKSQQVFWIKLLGANVNLGNIAPDDVIPLETLRLGLRGDTFFQFMPDSLAQSDVTKLDFPK